jgi:hypothetical protein
MLGNSSRSKDAVVVTIPRRWILSIRTCASSEPLITWLTDNGLHVPVYGHEAQLTLALALYSELYVFDLASCGVGFLRYIPQITWLTLRVGWLSAISIPEDGADRTLLGVQVFRQRCS